LLVVGNGMVGAKFCEYLVQEKLARSLEVKVVGAEPLPAYDRIRLSTYVGNRDISKLVLYPESWYADHGIGLLTGNAVEAIDRGKKEVLLSDGSRIGYDVLVLATGSRPFVPPIEGADLPGVFFYRTVADLDAIIAATEGSKEATVIGGGLLGLEAVQAVQKLGLSTAIVERARFLMPQQLNEAASRLLEKIVRSQDIALHLGVGSTTISRCGGRLNLCFDGEGRRGSDLVIISAGITPNSELAEDCGLPVGVRGGVVVDGYFGTEDDSIFAIGECALLNGRTYGLAAPGYAMARHLAGRLGGKKMASFPEPDLSTRLKMLGAEVITIGRPLEEGRRIEFSSDGHYRMITLGVGGLLEGGLGVGPWPEAGKIQTLYAERALIREKERHYFEQEGVLSSDGDQLDVSHWPEERVVCNCMSIKKGKLVNSIEACGRDPDRLASLTGASNVCGSCRPLLEQLCGTPVSVQKQVAGRSLFTVSVLAVFAVLATLLISPPAVADSVESWEYQIEQLWRDSVIKQITGYTLTAIFMAGLLISLRKGNVSAGSGSAILRGGGSSMRDSAWCPWVYYSHIPGSASDII